MGSVVRTSKQTLSDSRKGWSAANSVWLQLFSSRWQRQRMYGPVAGPTVWL